MKTLCKFCYINSGTSLTYESNNDSGASGEMLMLDENETKLKGEQQDDRSPWGTWLPS